MINYVTKDQLQKLLEAWQCSEPLPTRKTKILIAFPRLPQYQFAVIEVFYSDVKSTYGKRMWEVRFSQPYGV